MNTTKYDSGGRPPKSLDIAWGRDGGHQPPQPDKEPKIVGFLCNWCSYAGADLAGVSRMQYPTNIKIIRVMCSSRVEPLHILRCFQQGADGVLVSGCHLGDCHYQSGNYYTRRRLTLTKRLLTYLGIDPRRFQVAWVSASEGKKFAELVAEMTEELRALGPMQQLRRTNP